MQELRFLVLSSNNLSRNVDLDMLCQESKIMSILDLSSNKFSGALPPRLGNFEALDLGKNSFSGTIPYTFAEENGLEAINLNDNGFEGPIPKSLVNCSLFEVLDLGSNNFTDKFPHWLDTLPYLQVLVLRSNRFHELIRTSKTKFPFPKLQVIDVSHNYFISPLPKQYFKKFKTMTNINKTEYKLQYTETSTYYQYSLTIVVKGLIAKWKKPSPFL